MYIIINYNYKLCLITRNKFKYIFKELIIIKKCLQTIKQKTHINRIKLNLFEIQNKSKNILN